MPVIDQEHLDLAPISGVDQAGRIDQADPAAAGMAAARKHQAGVTRRDRNGDPGRHRDPLPRAENHLMARLQIQAGVTLMGARQAEIRWDRGPGG